MGASNSVLPFTQNSAFMCFRIWIWNEFHKRACHGIALSGIQCHVKCITIVGDLLPIPLTLVVFGDQIVNVSPFHPIFHSFGFYATSFVSSIQRYYE